MFDIGFGEILLIAVLALVVLGPEKFPAAIKTLGMWIGKAKRTINGIQSEISEELRLDEIKRSVSITKDELTQELDELKQPFVEAKVETEVETEVEAEVEAEVDLAGTSVADDNIGASDSDAKAEKK
ncbi:MAG: hypothetical protein OFPI_12510 [Osedax symbiont Rs2]|nr:MAG: hypothetical protein OFPI_12510 [Osedax symbiont Rs2]